MKLKITTLFFLIQTVILTIQINLNAQTQHSINEVLDNTGRILNGTVGSFNAEGMQMTYGKNGEPVFLDVGAGWSALGSGVNNAVNAIVISGNDVYVGGTFTTAGGITANRVAKWDGNNWSTLGTGLNNAVNAIALNGNDVYVGGTFTTAGEVTANRIAKWDGANWSALGTGLNNTVFAIAISGNDVYVGGTFTTAGGVTVNRIARWDGANWQSLGTGVDNGVTALAVNGTDVFAGGGFLMAGGIEVNRIAKWNGTNWSGVGLGVNNTVNAIAVEGNSIYIGGNFTMSGSDSINRIASWNGVNWVSLSTGCEGQVRSIIKDGNNVYVGGLFIIAGGDTARRIAKWDGSSWSSLGSGLSSNVIPVAIKGNELYVGGSFTTIANGDSASRIAKWSNDGSTPAGASGSSITSGSGPVNFPSTGVSLNINAGAGAGFVNVYRYEDAPQNVGGIPGTHNISQYRWIIQQKGLATPFTGTMRINIDSIPGNGINTPVTVEVYSRPTPGTGDFTLIAGTSFDSVAHEMVIPITTFSEFIFASEDNPLPVELISFSSLIVKNEVILDWSTSSELNNSGFEIFRSAQSTVGGDNGSWMNLGFVQGSGTTNESKSYSFIDRGLSTGKYNYRLRQIDYNGNFEYFNLSNEVIIGVPDKYDLSQNYPNPFNPVTKINFDLPFDSKVTMKIFDITGREIATLVNDVQPAGYYTVTFDARNIASGMYFYRIIAEGGNQQYVMTKKMVVIK